MSKKNNAKANNTESRVANVPNPPVPNRAHTEMKACCDNKSEHKAENKKN